MLTNAVKKLRARRAMWFRGATSGLGPVVVGQALSITTSARAPFADSVAKLPAQSPSIHVGDSIERSAERLLRLRDAAEATPQNLLPWKTLARALENARDEDGALTAWLRVLNLSDKDPDAPKRLAHLLRGSGRMTAAVPHLRAVAKHCGDGLELCKRLARLLEGAREDMAAILAWREVLSMDTTDRDAHFWLAELLHRSKDKNAAIPHLQALAQAGCGRKLRRRLALALECDGQDDAAISAWRDVVSMSADAEIEAHTHLAALLYQNNRKPEAVAHLRVIADTDACESHLLRLARCLKESGGSKESIEVWHRILDARSYGRELNPFLAHVLDRAPAYDSLLENTKERARHLLSEIAAVQTLLALATAFDNGPDAETTVATIFNSILGDLKRAIDGARVDEPEDLVGRWNAVREIHQDAGFIDLVARFPRIFDGFRRRMDKAADTSPFVDVGANAGPDAGLHLGRFKFHAARSSSAKLPQQRLSGEQILESERFWSPLLICGFHHSGTRLIAQLLHTAGVFQHVNRPSYEWEYVQMLNTLLLPGWMKRADIDAFQATPSATTLIDAESIALRLAAAGYDGRGDWALKDPRNCITARAWLDVFPKGRILHIIRDPRDTVGTLPQSYRRFMPADVRQEDMVTFWGNLWESYVLKSRQTMLSTHRALEIRFEDLVSNPIGVVWKAADSLDLRCDVESSTQGISILREKAGEYRKWLKNGSLSESGVIFLEELGRRHGYRKDISFRDR